LNESHLVEITAFVLYQLSALIFPLLIFIITAVQAYPLSLAKESESDVFIHRHIKINHQDLTISFLSKVHL